MAYGALFPLFVALAFAFTPKPGVKYSAVQHGSDWKIAEGSVGVATGVWHNSLHETGWHRLDLWTDHKETDMAQVRTSLGLSKKLGVRSWIS